ncbi:MAG: hypothetical protein M5R36_28235 [Deltaproteobacteria bacterium]|nr:hypothetical protein [Deltaproteobacteria bacterium]
MSNVGAIWPEIADGRPTGQSVIHQVGDMEIVDIFGGLGFPKENPFGLVVFTFRGRLNMFHPVGRHMITEDEVNAFADLLIDKVNAFL